MTQLSSGLGGLDTATAARAIVLVSGSSSLRRAILPGLVLILATGIGVTFMF